MPTINQLGGTEIVKDNDLIPIYKIANRRTRNVSAIDFANYAAATSPVQSVNGQTGNVILDTDDVQEGDVNLYFTEARAAAAAPVQSVDGETGDVDLSGVYAPLTHVGSRGVTQHALADADDDGFMSKADFIKLSGIQEDAENNTASNLGAGSGVFSAKVSSDLQFKSLVAGANVTLTPSSTEILISVAAADLLNTTRIDVSSAATVNLTSSAPSTRNIRITGTTTITGFTVTVGALYFVSFSGALTLTNNAAIVTNRGANISVSAGDSCIIRATAANTIEVLCGSFLADRKVSVSQATTSGTAIDFTAIPAWANRITVTLGGVSTSGTSNLIMQIGSGSVLTSGYASSFDTFNTTPGTSAITSGFGLSDAVSAVGTTRLVATLIKVTGNTWVEAHSGSSSDPGVALGGGTVSLGGALDRVRLTTAGGTDTFDAGAVSITYEG